MGVRPDQRDRLAERHRGRDRLRRQAGRRAVHRQGVQPDQPVRRDQADRGQAVHQRQPLRGGVRHPLRRGPVRQRDGQPRLDHPEVPRAARGRPVAADHRPALHPVPDHAAAGGRVRGRLVRADDRRRAVRAADPVDEGDRPGRGDRARREDARHGPAPGREAARGDDQPGGRPPRARGRQPLRAPARPGQLGLPAAVGRHPGRRTASTTRRTPTTCGTRSKRSARSWRATSDRVAVWTPIDLGAGHRGCHRRTAGRLAHHRTCRHRVRERRVRAVRWTPRGQLYVGHRGPAHRVRRARRGTG